MYARKSKTVGKIAVMGTPLGVRTRAKTLALQKSNSCRSPPSPLSDGGSYLELRSRRLQKSPILLIRSSTPRKQAAKEISAQNPDPNYNSQNSISRLNSGRGDSGLGPFAVELSQSDLGNAGFDEERDEKMITDKEISGERDADLIVDASFGESLLEMEGRERTIRESTPCSLIRDAETLRSMGSTTNPKNSLTYAKRRAQSSSIRHLPTPHEMDEFFAGAEEEQQRRFVEKYNFDPVNDKPIPGRYEWEKVDH